MMATEERHSATMAWIEDVVALHPELWNHVYEFETRAGMLWVLVEGSDYEALAWRAAVGGRLQSSKVIGGVWSKEVLGVRCHVRVTDRGAR
jgi:hypothetical protein